MTQSNMVSIQTTPNGGLNIKAMKKAMHLIQNMKRKEEMDRKRWRVMNLYGVEIRDWQMPVLNATV